MAEKSAISERQEPNTNTSCVNVTAANSAAVSNVINSSFFVSPLRSSQVVRCPYRESWLSGASQKAGRSARQHAEWYVPTTRTWSESTFKNALGEGRDKDAVMKVFWGNYVDLVEKEVRKREREKKKNG